MEVIAKVDEVGKGAWIALLVLSFILFWPIGLALLFFLLWSGRMGCGSRNSERWHERAQARRKGWHGKPPQSSGNVAFDEYRDETLKRLEEEQEEFNDFLHRLRHAKDRAEFEQFMAERRRPKATDDADGPSTEPPRAEPNEPAPAT